jgi:signal peptidase I
MSFHAFRHATKAAFDESKDSIFAAAKFFSLYYFVENYVVDVTTCIGPSMLPTFDTVGDVVLLERISAHLSRLERGDVIIAQSPTKAKQNVCKRIRAIAGDQVCLKYGGR